jgi:hypothetical protein
MFRDPLLLMCIACIALGVGLFCELSPLMSVTVMLVVVLCALRSFL